VTIAEIVEGLQSADPMARHRAKRALEALPEGERGRVRAAAAGSGRERVFGHRYFNASKG
jgi:hypothetical protein